MSILLAVGDPDFTEILRGNFVSAGFDVIDNDVYHRKYLDEVIQIENPSILVLHDAYLPSDTTTAQDNEEEMLRLIGQWRATYDNDLRIVYLCERERRDPFLGSLVARNVLDIFNERQIATSLFIEQLANDARFANVAKFGVGQLEVEFDEEPEVEGTTETLVPTEVEAPSTASSQKVERAKQLLSQFSDKAKSVVDSSNEWNQQRLKEKQERTPRSPKNIDIPDGRSAGRGANDANFTDYLDLMPIPKEIYARTQVMGTVVVAVAGAKPHLGSTHTAMSIAAFLQKGRHSVALIEANYSEDFDRIHALYEGEQQYIRKQAMFDYQGIDHYKFREDLRLGEIMATYEYVVLDIGAIDDSPHYDEFLRAHVRVLHVSPYEWKQHWTDRFCEQVKDEEYFTFVVPFAGKANVKDMKERLPKLNIVPFPANPNPYSVNEEEEEAIRSIMHGYIKESKQVFSKKALIGAVVVSAVITTGVISAFVLL
ncbi:hypothetical protein [Sporosarcina sp. FSL K6-1508]|uniref:hypothetical protein n=1 Tax=Sporosarcina sp. FSL K6-1508 TaxID=2921553 RepID=UPI0030F96BEA